MEPIFTVATHCLIKILPLMLLVVYSLIQGVVSEFEWMKIIFKNGADICNCTGTTTITCSGNKYLWLIIVGAVVGVVVIVVIGFFFWKKYKRGKN